MREAALPVCPPVPDPLRPWRFEARPAQDPPHGFTHVACHRFANPIAIHCEDASSLFLAANSGSGRHLMADRFWIISKTVSPQSWLICYIWILT
jgi:hypothetical protein